jgi:tetratricopeptide (TPR) repeat protein
MTDVTSQFEKAAAHLLSEPEPELTPAVLAAARAVLAVPESRLSEPALQMLVQIVLFLDTVAEATDRAAGEASAENLEQLLHRTDLDDMSRAHLLYLRSERLTSLGRRADAMADAEELAGISWALSERDPDQLPMFASTQARLASLLGSLGRRGEAADRQLEAVSVWRTLSATDPVNRRSLGAALNNAANLLGDDGRFDAAVESASEAVSIYRDLAAGDPGLSLELAAALRNLATALNVSGDRFEALAPAREAVRTLRSITGDSQARSDLADALSSLSIFLAETGDDRGALKAAEEAVGLAREPGGQPPLLAGALTTLTNRLSHVGRLDDALAAAGEAVRIYEGLAKDDAVFVADVALATSNLASLLRDAGRYGEALTHAQKALRIRRGLVQVSPSYRSDLANSLVTVANLLDDGGRPSEALDLAREVVEIRQAEASDNPRLTGGLANALDAMAVFAKQANDDETALAASDRAVTILRDASAGNRAFLPDLAKALTNHGAMAPDSAEAVRSLDEAVGIYRDLAAGNDGFRPELAASLDNLASALAEAGRTGEALVPAVEAVEIHRGLAAARRARAPDLSGALHNLANRLEEAGRARDALEASVEILGLEGRTDATAAAVHRLLEVPPEDRPDGAGDLIAGAIDRVGELIPLALWTVDDPGDRRTVMSALAWMASAGAVYLARERRDLGHALEWVDRTITLDLRATAAMRGTEFAVLSERRPDLAARLRRSLGTPASPHDRPDEPLVDVIREVRESGSGFDRFLLPRTAAEITTGLRTTTVILAAGPRDGVLLVATPQGAMSAMPMSMSFDEIAELVTMSLAPQPVQVLLSHERLRSLVLDRILPDLRSQAADGAELLVVPVGVMNWLPIQPVAARAGLALELRPALTSSTSESKPPGPPLVVHSHGRGRKLDAGLEESKRVAAMLGVEPVTDPVDLAEVGDRLGSSSFVHFACHGVADVADPDASGLRLGPRDEDRLTVRALAATMIEKGAPRFVALSACQTGRTELAIPEQASSIGNVFIGHGARCVLSTLWNVDDRIARDFGIEFVRRWRSGTTAGEAYDLTLQELATRLTDDLRTLSTLNAFQLIGDRHLTWPTGFPA